MPIKPFKLERYFAQYEFAARYLLSSSDCEPLTMAELLSYATEAQRALWDDLWLGYTESKGHPLLLGSVAELYDGIDPGQVLGAVPEEGIFIVMNALLEAGDHIIVISPAYQSLYQLADALGCTVSNWMPDPANWQFNVNRLADLMRADTKIIVINFPHNPTGTTLTKEQFAQVIELANQHDCIVFSDEMYRWSERDARDRLPSACEIYDSAVTLCGLSKTFALPGLRVGWLVTQNDELMQRFVHFKDYTTICASAPSEILAIIALGARDRLIERTRRIVSDNLSVLKPFFDRYDGLLRWQPPQAGTITLVELLHDMPVDQFAAELVRSEGVMIVPASQFEMDGNYFRLGFGRRNLPEALECFETFLQKLTT
jgi:aspartate/methionine/tyrosine aminotransferase